MTAFVGAPTEPHIGQCQNLIKGSRADWRDSYHCLAPVLALGAALPADRDICQECRADTAQFGRWLAAEFARTLRNPDEWIAMTRDRLDDLRWWYARRASERAPMAELYRIDRDIARREGLLAAVLSGATPDVPEQPRRTERPERLARPVETAPTPTVAPPYVVTVELAGVSR